jgi:SulP family sulfate permease
VLGALPQGLPGFSLPSMVTSDITPVLLGGLAVALISFADTSVLSRTYAGRTASFVDPNQEMVGLGAANVAAGLFQGMPVGGSVSASALNKAAGARSRQSLFVAGIVMALVILLFGAAIGYVAMPALAGLLMLIGYRTIKPDDLRSVWRTGVVQKAVLVITFTLTMLIPLQYAVLVGVGVSVILHIVRQSNQVTIRRRVRDADGHLVETDPPAVLPAGEVVVLQPYGSLFFAAAPVFEAQLPAVGESSTGTVVILRLRGRSDLGTTFMDVLLRYAETLTAAGSRLMIVSTNPDIDDQLDVTGITAVVGADAIFRGDHRVGAATARAVQDATDWIGDVQGGGEPGTLRS